MLAAKLVVVTIAAAVVTAVMLAVSALIGMAMLDREIEEIHLEEERKVAAAIASLLSAAGDIIRVKDIEAAAVLLYRVSEEIIHRIRIIGTDIGDGRLLGELEDMVCRYLLVEG